MGQHEILQIILIPTDDPSFSIVFLLIPIILTSLPDFRLLMSAAELDLLLGGLSTSREGRLSNEDRFGILSMRKTMTMTLIGIEYFSRRLFMSIPPSPASGAKKPSSGDQVIMTIIMMMTIMVMIMMMVIFIIIIKVLALKRDEKKGRKKKPMLTGQKLQLIR